MFHMMLYSKNLTTGEASDREATVDWAATPVEACVSAENIAGDTPQNVTAAMAHIGDVHQHPLRGVYTNMMAEHIPVGYE